MKFLILFFALVASVWSAPAIDNNIEPIPVVRRTDDYPHADGSYGFNYETGNGIKFEETGEIKPGLTRDAVGIPSVHGSYSYVADDGTPIQVIYTADENGFQPQGAHIPAIPIGIIRALEWIAAHPEEDNLK